MEEKLDLILNELRSLDRQVAELRTEIRSANSVINNRFDTLETIISDLQMNLAMLNTRLDYMEDIDPQDILSLFKNRTIH